MCIRDRCMVALGIVLNIVGAFIALNLRLPIYLDSVGTVLSGALLGPVYGVATGVLGSLISGITFDIYSLYYCLLYTSIVLLSGGLGPTEDDITRETVAKVLGREMKEVPEIHQQIQAYFERMGSKRPSSNNWRQAMVIEGAQIVENHNGTAPGMIVPVDDTKSVSYTHLRYPRLSLQVRIIRNCLRLLLLWTSLQI